MRQIIRCAPDDILSYRQESIIVSSPCSREMRHARLLSVVKPSKYVGGIASPKWREDGRNTARLHVDVSELIFYFAPPDVIVAAAVERRRRASVILTYGRQITDARIRHVGPGPGIGGGIGESSRKRPSPRDTDGRGEADD